MLQVHDLTATATFWKEQLGFTVVGSWGHDPAEPTWADLARDGQSIMFSQVDDHVHEDGTTHAHEVTLGGSIYLNVDDVDALVAESLDGWKAAGVPIEWELQTFDHGMREIGIRDPNGFLVILGSGVDAT